MNGYLKVMLAALKSVGYERGLLSFASKWYCCQATSDKTFNRADMLVEWTQE
jgi:hypothetical protein